MASENETDVINDFIPSRQFQFWTILGVEIPSLFCTLYLLYHLCVRKKLRNALHNHVIILLLVCCLIVQVVDNPLYLDAYLHQGRNSFPPSVSVCLIWWLVDYGVYGAVTILLAWASFERHLIIFSHFQCLSTRRQRILFHYLPLILLLVYLIGFYIGVIIFPPCKNIFDYESEACGSSPCYEQIESLNIWDYLINGTAATIFEAICSISLLIRVVRQRYRVQQSIHWRKHRRLAIQILSISALSLSITLPQALITSIQQILPGMGDFANTLADYLFYLTTFVVLGLPFICLGCQSELWPRRFNRSRTRIRPCTVIPFHTNAVKNLSRTVTQKQHQRCFFR